MDFFTCVMERRTCRRFKQDPVPEPDILKILDAARYIPTGFNKQPNRYAVINSPAKATEAFLNTGWLTGKPPDHQRPPAYIVVYTDDNIVPAGEAISFCAAGTVMLAAWALGYGTCWHRTPESLHDTISDLTGVTGPYTPHVLISLGKPDETYEVTDPSDNIKVEKDENGVVHLGKLGMDTVLLSTV